MKKTTLFLLLVTVFTLLCFTGCGDTDDPGDTGVSQTYSFDIEDIPEDAAQKAIITCKDGSSGEVVWQVETEPTYVAQLDNLQSIGLCANGYMYIREGAVICLDPKTGEVLWEQEQFGGAGASWCFDDDGCIYLCGYFGPELVKLSPTGEVLQFYPTFGEYSEWTEGCFYASDIALAEDGSVYISYDNNGKTLKIDQETGDVIDIFPASKAIDPEMLPGMWVDATNGEENMLLQIYDDLSYDLFYFAGDGTKYTYSGTLVLEEFSEVSEGPDFFSLTLESTDDAIFEGWSSIGDFVIEHWGTDGEDTWMNLVQMNNGDSFFSIHFDNVYPLLYKVEAVG